MDQQRTANFSVMPLWVHTMMMLVLAVAGPLATCRAAPGLAEAPAREGGDPPAPAEPATASPPSDFPDWLNTAPTRNGNVYRRVVVSDPFSTSEECQRQLDDKIQLVTWQYLCQLTGTRTLPSAPMAAMQLDRLGVDSQYVRERICRDQYVEFLESSVDRVAGAMGRMRQIHVLMQFDSQVHDDLVRRWKGRHREERLVAAGVVSAVVLLCIGFLYGYLKLDLWTGGAYRGRLRLAAALVAAAALIALAAALD